MSAGRTLLEKLWQEHVVLSEPGGADLLYVDLHLTHEATSAQAFEGLRLSERTVRRPELTLATADHSVPTRRRHEPWPDSLAVAQVAALSANCEQFGVPLFGIGDPRQGIVHVIGPEEGLTQPGMMIVCGDSHTSTHGALGALAFGIGTSEVEHVLASQTLWQRRPKTMSVTVTGSLHRGVTAKDVALAVIRAIGTAGGAGHVIEYRGEVIRALSMEGRLTICNMSIECGAKAGMVGPDETTYAYLEGRKFVPRGRDWERALERWRALPTDEGAIFDTEVVLDGTMVEPHVTWGTTPAQSVPVTGRVPDPDDLPEPGARETARRALAYMGLEPGTAVQDMAVDRVFIGSCTNSRIEDLRAAAEIVRGHKAANTVRAMVSPGSGLVKLQAEREGLDRVFIEAGFEWREAGCSMCVAMNGDDVVSPGERCASTSNRNFEGRQGPSARTHLVSPPMAAAAAIAGRFVDVREVS